MNLQTDLDHDEESGSAASSTKAGSDRDLFEGDTGKLKADTRRVLVQLLLGPSVDGQRQSKLWPVLVRDEDIVRSRLHELFLELVIDHDHQVAFTRQVAADGVDIPILLRKSRLTFVETVLLIFLREKLTQAEAQGDRAVVSRDDINEHLAVFERASNQDHARYAKQIGVAIEKLKERNVLRLLRGTDERMEVSPTLKLLFSAEEIQALTARYQTLAAGPAQLDIDERADNKNEESSDE